MSTKNIYHDAVVHALTDEGWTITDDPLVLKYGGRNLFVDLGAERTTIGAEKGTEKIAVEIQSFLNQSPIRDLEEAVGQYTIYKVVLEESREERMLFMAVPERVFHSLILEPFGRLIVARVQVRIIVFSEEREKIIRWINLSDIEKLFSE